MPRKLSTHNKGFTLVELITVIIVLGVVSVGISGFIRTGIQIYTDTTERDQCYEFSRNQARQHGPAAQASRWIYEPSQDIYGDASQNQCGCDVLQRRIFNHSPYKWSNMGGARKFGNDNVSSEPGPWAQHGLNYT